MKEMKQKNLTGNEEIQNSESRDTALQITETPLRTYKDRLFRMLFKDKERFLELYNAMNDTSYDNPEDMIVTTLENAIYMGMKNDVSFLLYDQLLLYEHQSTKNPNMPLRDLFYVANVYSALLKDEDLLAPCAFQFHIRSSSSFIMEKVRCRKKRSYGCPILMRRKKKK